MNRALTKSEVKHLRLLLGWLDCEIGPSPKEMIAMAKELAPTIGKITVGAALRMNAALEKSESVPVYVRSAVKALQKTLVKNVGEVIDVEKMRTK